MKIIEKGLLVPALLASFAAMAQLPVPGGQGWTHSEFDDIEPSDYQWLTRDGERVLQARCDASASLYGVQRRIDLQEQPVLSWEWRVARVYENIEERNKSGDDFPARVYAVIDGGLFIWRTRALNYVWSSEEAVGSDWPNPFRSQAHMIVVASGPSGKGQWRSASRNLVTDFKRYFDMDIDAIDGIAVMSDCDNTGGETTAWFRNIRFSAP
tara:strand:+ start:5129 stop:5761 length:633 start_codon:yes stop_codon:yes gene_type:complete